MMSCQDGFHIPGEGCTVAKCSFKVTPNCGMGAHHTAPLFLLQHLRDDKLAEIDEAVELGQQWISNLCEPPGLHELYISELALVEVVHVLCVKADIKCQGKTPRRQAHIRKERDDLIAAFLGHCDPLIGQYLVHVMDSGIYDTAVHLRMHHSIESGDALQLAYALEIRTDALGSGTNPPEFICADKRLREAANSEGFTVRNPEDYAEPHEVNSVSRATTSTTPEVDKGWRKIVHAAGKWLAAR